MTTIKVNITGLPAWINKPILEAHIVTIISEWIRKQRPPVMPPMDTTKSNLRKLFD